MSSQPREWCGGGEEEIQEMWKGLNEQGYRFVDGSEEDRNCCRRIKNTQLWLTKRRNIGGEWGEMSLKNKTSPSVFFWLLYFCDPVFQTNIRKLWDQQIYNQDYLKISRLYYYSRSTLFHNSYVHPFTIFVHLILIEILVCARKSAWHLQLNHVCYCSVNQPEQIIALLGDWR